MGISPGGISTLTLGDLRDSNHEIKTVV
jgi:hypothetical protein